MLLVGSTLKTQIKSDLKTSMLARDSSRSNVLKSILSELTYAEKGNQGPSHTDPIQILRRMVKKREDSVQQFSAAGRNDLVEQETHELKIITSYMPKQMDSDEIKSIVIETIGRLGAKSPKDMGRVMKELKSKLDPATAPSDIVATEVKKALSPNEAK